MAEKRSPDIGEGASRRAPAEQNTCNHPDRFEQRMRTGSRVGPLSIGIATVAAALASVSLIVTLQRSGPTASPADTIAPTYSAVEVAAAQQQLCYTYKLVARAVQVDTNGNDLALGRVAATNAAAMLDNAAANPALDTKHRDSARALASAYRTTTAMAGKGVATDVEWQARLDDVNAKDAVMKRLCADGGD